MPLQGGLRLHFGFRNSASRLLLDLVMFTILCSISPRAQSSPDGAGPEELIQRLQKRIDQLEASQKVMQEKVDHMGAAAQMYINKEGDPYLRTLLVQGAHHILGQFGADSDLRRWGLKLAERGGKSGKKRAVIAVARKLAILLHHLWVSGEVYEPLRKSKPTAMPTAA